MKNITLLFLTLFAASTATADQPIQVVASVKPLQLVVEGVVGELGEVDSLIPAGSSPHHYSLKPSDLRKLNTADLAVWVGPDMEQFLSKALERSKVPTVQLLEGSGEGHHDHHELHGHDEHDHHNHAVDPHVWMDPVKMLKAAAEIKKALVKLHPEQAEQLNSNYQQFAADILATDRAIQAQLATVREKGFIVFHDAFAPFVEHYDMNQRGYFTVDPARAPGAKKLQAIQTMLKEDQVGCIFTEPQFEAKVIQRIVAKQPVKLGKLDPLAIDITSEQGYTGFLKQLANNMETCLR
ncbi:zinc ABC transporter substrate-binding protein [Neptuniibacter sp. QD37_11]|uniref:zinc ABC transporter substrate-binding protein n=1 Tax=Neptuniibacter sp. QD37_11 TaxID=3398209 RepID=UPI0039F53388